MRRHQFEARGSERDMQDQLLDTMDTKRDLAVSGGGIDTDGFQR
jgi:hypothetical protein